VLYRNMSDLPRSDGPRHQAAQHPVNLLPHRDRFPDYRIIVPEWPILSSALFFLHSAALCFELIARPLGLSRHLFSLLSALAY